MLILVDFIPPTPRENLVKILKLAFFMRTKKNPHFHNGKTRGIEFYKFHVLTSHCKYKNKEIEKIFANANRCAFKP